MAITDYAELQTAVANRMNRTDLAALIPEFVAFAEAEFNRVLRLPLQYEGEAALTVSSRFTDLPADFLEMDRVIWLDGTTRRPMHFVGESSSQWDDDGSDASNWPRFFALRGTKIEVLPAPTGSRNLRISYWKKISALAAGVNALFQAHPDLYLYRACYEAAVYMMDKERMTFYLGLYDRLMTEVIEFENRGERASDITLRTELQTRGGFNIYTG